LLRVLVFAYDGSLNDDWVAHYAARFAANTDARRLHLVHVHDADGLSAHVPDRLARIAAECAVLGVELETQLVARGGADVASRILDLTPPGATVVAGARMRPRARALLAGTVSARLLDTRRVPVIAIRVVHPGALGQPGRVLLPVADRAGFAAGALPLLRLLGADLDRLHVLLVREVSRLRARLEFTEAVQRLLADGHRRLALIEDELRVGLAPHVPMVDSSVVGAPDAAHEIALQAARHRSRLICLDADAPLPTGRLIAGDPLERVLRDAPADVAVYRSGS
jgi:nucleotide-binding universal stress UspA family protein